LYDCVDHNLKHDGMTQYYSNNDQILFKVIV
jgi:hypothetical protein